MIVGILSRGTLALSAGRYVTNVVEKMEPLGVTCVSVGGQSDGAADVDVLWDPWAMGGAAPDRRILEQAIPSVVTVHGAAPWVLKGKDYYATGRSEVMGRLRAYKERIRWRKFRERCAAFIAVSEYGKEEVVRYLGLNEKKVAVVWHGVDHRCFTDVGIKKSTDGYFLHVSQWQPKKNFDRILQAYSMLEIRPKPRLIAVVPGYQRSGAGVSGVEIIARKVSDPELAALYRGALALVFPSLHETFGMPILEAMACGCPVITSDRTACPEISGGCALFVNPESAVSIAEGMDAVAGNMAMRLGMRRDGLAWAGRFSWDFCARKHVEIFQRVIVG